MGLFSNNLQYCKLQLFLRACRGSKVLHILAYLATIVKKVDECSWCILTKTWEKVLEKHKAFSFWLQRWLQSSNYIRAKQKKPSSSALARRKRMIDRVFFCLSLCSSAAASAASSSFLAWIDGIWPWRRTCRKQPSFSAFSKGCCCWGWEETR